MKRFGRCQETQKTSRSPIAGIPFCFMIITLIQKQGLYLRGFCLCRNNDFDLKENVAWLT